MEHFTFIISATDVWKNDCKSLWTFQNSFLSFLFATTLYYMGLKNNYRQMSTFDYQFTNFNFLF